MLIAAKQLLCVYLRRLNAVFTTVDDLFRSSTIAFLAMYVLIAAAVTVGLFFAVRTFVRMYLKYRGMRIVICPETKRSAAIEVIAARAAVTCLYGGGPEVRLKSCSRWPKRKRCPQDCILQLDASPVGCRLRSMLTEWYAGKQCSYCGRKFETISWLDPKPALLSPEGSILEWEAMAPEDVPDALSSDKPVCAECKVVETFRAEHAHLVIDRPWKH
jgi:hypothetical protein